MMNIKSIKIATNRFLRDFLLQSRRIEGAVDGVAAIEFAMVMPVLLLLTLGGLQFAMTLHNYQRVTNAVAVGARYLTLSRGAAAPLTTTLSAMMGSLTNLDPAGLKVSLAINGKACTTDVVCRAAMVSGTPTTVTAEYPCKIVVLGIDFAPTCKLTATVKGILQ